MSRILAVDPGPHVGVALWDDRKFSSWEETPGNLYASIDGWVPAVNVLVYEGFRIGGARGKASNETIEMIGVMRWVCGRHGVDFVEQPPGAGKKWAGERWAKLRRIDWYRPGPDHANSAAGHLCRYLAHNEPGFAESLLP